MSYRFACVAGPQHTVEQCLPDNYYVVDAIRWRDRDFTLIGGHDDAGWTLDGYVLPRLASGLYFGSELITTDAEIPNQTPADEAWWEAS